MDIYSCVEIATVCDTISLRLLIHFRKKLLLLQINKNTFTILCIIPLVKRLF